ncbi:unnamed protein product, partial [Staurois parvus]
DKNWNTTSECEGDLKVAHGQVWRWRQQHGRPLTGTRMRPLWTWQGSMRRRYRGGPWQIRGLAAAMGRPVICQHPMTKWNTSSV